ncbi:MAG: Mov34/MPN/PAD-1 family protein [Candidatus Lokiarchaeota archaeon]|nr:Mov34/MPN/PAD-1 family protein [Candidatus Lokiarchaeota archaeon]
MRFERDIAFVIGRDLISNINKCIEKAYPNEACGFLFGDIQEINNKGNFKYIYYSEFFQCIESSTTSPASFLIDNDKQILELSNLTLDKKDLKLLAIFHSHPTGASPSSIDKKCMKYYHNCGIMKFTHLVWIIVDSRNKDINGFIYLDNKLTQIIIEVIED